jgi:hypothetical protein
VNYVYLVCENVDLGYNVTEVYSDGDMAARVCKTLNEEHRAKKISDLMAHCNYTREAAEDYARYDQFFVEQRDVL